MKKKKVTFPHMGSYHVVFEYLARKTLDFEVLVPPPITKKTLELGAKYSPEFVCIPFKYNLGNYIEALELGADIILQAGGGCRFGYYGEIQEQILKDLGYNFEFIDICSSGKVTPITLFKSFRKLNNKLSFFKFLYYVLLAIKMAYILDEIEFYLIFHLLR
jgi:predicted nucleotide-binding protein (sugar kinase/HSP70/actin superfamily)